MTRDPRIEALYASQRAGEGERLRKIEIEAAEAFWESLTEEQRELLTSLGNQGHSHLDRILWNRRQEQTKGFGKH